MCATFIVGVPRAPSSPHLCPPPSVSPGQAGRRPGQGLGADGAGARGSYLGDGLARRRELHGRDQVCDVLPDHLLPGLVAMQVSKETVARRYGSLGGKAGDKHRDTSSLHFSFKVHCTSVPSQSCKQDRQHRPCAGARGARAGHRIATPLLPQADRKRRFGGVPLRPSTHGRRVRERFGVCYFTGALKQCRVIAAGPDFLGEARTRAGWVPSHAHGH